MMTGNNSLPMTTEKQQPPPKRQYKRKKKSEASSVLPLSIKTRSTKASSDDVFGNSSYSGKRMYELFHFY
jgi:hypothetical protein